MKPLLNSFPSCPGEVAHFSPLELRYLTFECTLNLGFWLDCEPSPCFDRVDGAVEVIFWAKCVSFPCRTFLVILFDIPPGQTKYSLAVEADIIPSILEALSPIRTEPVYQNPSKSLSLNHTNISKLPVFLHFRNMPMHLLFMKRKTAFTQRSCGPPITLQLR